MSESLRMNNDENLAVYAAQDASSRGRLHKEKSATGRSEYQRDRDRIIHSSAFRLLEYKTQVFMNHEGDLYRTRLTHSLEVGQVSRSLARNLRLNEDLAETIALAHDLGHTPFGHAGQDALDECMKPYGGFEHNLQSLRIVEVLEDRYPTFRGLNLTFESREGILKHCSANNARLLGDVGERFLEKTQPSLEAQLVNLADEIAYSNHDIDDGIRSGLISATDLMAVEIFARHATDVRSDYPGIAEQSMVNEVIRRIINELVVDLSTTSRQLIADANPKSIDDVRSGPKLIMFSDKARAEATELKRFLKTNLYSHYTVNRMRLKARKVIRDLFSTFMDDPSLLSPEYKVKDGDQMEQARKVADYVAGMTDRYAYKEHRRMFEIDV